MAGAVNRPPVRTPACSLTLTPSVARQAASVLRAHTHTHTPLPLARSPSSPAAQVITCFPSADSAAQAVLLQALVLINECVCHQSLVPFFASLASFSRVRLPPFSHIDCHSLFPTHTVFLAVCLAPPFAATAAIAAAAARRPLLSQIQAIIITLIAFQAIAAPLVPWTIKGTAPAAEPWTGTVNEALVAAVLAVAVAGPPAARAPAAAAAATHRTDARPPTRTPTRSAAARAPTSMVGNWKNSKRRSKPATIRTFSCAKRLPCASTWLSHAFRYVYFVFLP